MHSRLTVFETTLGTAAVAWAERGLTGVCLPLGGRAQALARIRRRHRGAAEAPPPAPVREAVDEIAGLLAGEPRGLTGVELDMRGVEQFDRRVYSAARTIAPGATRTYGELAAMIGAPQEARAVGAALARNPFPLVVPCHRVLAAGGGLGGFSAPGGVATKLRLLGIEGVPIARQPSLFT
jgi:methylated-DNA-[protein]-cysteine S-methyltransferase